MARKYSPFYGPFFAHNDVSHRSFKRGSSIEYGRPYLPAPAFSTFQEECDVFYDCFGSCRCLFIYHPSAVEILPLGAEYNTVGDWPAFGPFRPGEIYIQAESDLGGGLFLAKRHPGGIGWNHFEDTVEKYIQEKQLIRKQPSNQIHNEYLTLLVEGGIPSLLAYLLFLWGCLTVLYSLRKKKDSLKVALLGSTFAGILVFALIGGIFDERQVLAVYFWTIFGAIISQNEGMLSIGGETGHGIP